MTTLPTASRQAPSQRVPPPPRRVEIVVSAATVAKAIAVAFCIVLVYFAQEALLSIALAVVLVMGLDPAVSALERRGWGRGRAALTIFAVITLILLVLVVWAVRPLWAEVENLVDALPGYVDEVQQAAPFEQIDRDTDAFAKLESVAADAAKSLPDAAAGLLGAAASAVGSAFALVTLAFLTLFGLVARPSLEEAALRLMRPEPAARVARTVDAVSRTISFSLLGNLVISVIAGTVVGVAAWLVGAPSPVVLALVVALFDLIPQIGSAIAAVIVVTVTLIASGAGPALVLLVVILVYQQAENYLIQPAVMRQAVELSGFATIAAVMLGGALLGVVGAILAVPVAASVKVIANEVTAGRRARMDALREEQAPEPA